MPHEDFIIAVFCLVDDQMKKITLGRRLRAGGFPPKLTDSEVITMDIVGEFLRKDTDVGIWRYFKSHWLALFPRLGSRSNYAKQSASLWHFKQKIQEKLSTLMGALLDPLHMADGFPIPICHFSRANGSASFRDSAAYGYCASKKETYYGFKGNVVISSEGVIYGITVTPANVDERESLWEIIPGLKGMVIADKGLIGQEFQEELRDHLNLNLQTPLKSNMEDPRSKSFMRWLVSTRRLVETVIGQLADRFNIEKVRARDLWHLTSRITRKILAHTVAMVINKSLGNPPLQFELLEIR